MASSTFTVLDEHAQPWSIRPGDPAYDLVLKLPLAVRKSKQLYLPRAAVATGCITERMRLEAAHRLGRLTNTSHDLLDHDEDLRAAYVLYVGLDNCLRALTTPIKFE